MTISLDRLPFDVLFYIAASLSFDDIVQLSLTCRALRNALDENTLYRRCIETHVSHSREAKLAQQGAITYREAFLRVKERREAFAKAYPYSVRLVGKGTAFTYRQGILCVLHDHTLRLSDLHSAAGNAWEIDLSAIFQPIASGGSPDQETRVSLLYYSDNIITAHYERKGRPNGNWLFAIDTRPNRPDDWRRLATIELRSSTRLFARHNASFLYWGTHSAAGTHGHREWEIEGVSLDHTHTFPADARPVQLEDFFGTDIGSSVAFEIHDGHFYALSNQTSYDVEEVDWTSFYHCARFPLEKPSSNDLQINRRIYRRQHSEGPIHDSWTDLSLQVDEFTNDLVIVESRREWLDGASKQYRTFYSQLISFPEDTSSEDGSSDADAINGPPLPEDDIYLSTLTSVNQPNWAPQEKRYERYYHPEYGIKNDTARSFVLSKTKFRAYSLSCSAFIDIVEDDRCCTGPHSEPAGPCLRLRVGSRRQAASEYLEEDKFGPLTENASNVKSLSSERYRYSPIKLWPPSAPTCPCAAKLHRILNPLRLSGPSYTKTIMGVVDERSLVYLIRPGRPYGDDDTPNPMGRIVLVAFDKEMGSSVSPASPDAAGVVDIDGIAEEEFHWRWEPGACQRGGCH